MTMQKNKGHAAITDNSEKSEKIFIRALKKAVSEFPEFTLKPYITTEDLYGTTTSSRTKAGKPTQIEPDGGWLCYNGKIVGCSENKFQTGHENAVERAHKYGDYAIILNFPRSNIFINLEGPAFEYDGEVDGVKTISGQSGVFVETARRVGYTLFINETEEALFGLLCNKLQEIKDYYTNETDTVI